MSQLNILTWSTQMHEASVVVASHMIFVITIACNQKRENLLQAENSRIGRVYHSFTADWAERKNLFFMLWFSKQNNQKTLDCP